MAKIDHIRLLLSHDDGVSYHEIFKIIVETNKDDFYLVKKGNAIKISFHKDGKKYLRIRDKFRGELYKDEQYDAQNLNPVFVYLPKRIDDYPIISGNKSWHADIKMICKSDSDVAIKVYQVNYKDGGVYLSEKDKHTSSLIVEGHDLAGNLIKKDAGICLLDFGNQKLYFDFCYLNKKDLSKDIEHILIFKPGIDIDVTNYINSIKFPNNKNGGCQISKYKDGNSYFVSF